MLGIALLGTQLSVATIHEPLDVIGNSELWYNVHSYPAFLVKE
jgi:hypothetical protein